jgi:hypothetical protein
MIKSVEDGHKLIAEYIATHGMAKFNSIDMKEIDRPLFYEISKRLGGFKKIKSSILDGTISIPGYNLVEDTNEPEEVAPPVNEISEFNEDKVPENKPKVDSDINAILSNMSFQQEQMLSLIQNVINEMNAVKASVSNTKTNVDIMHDKLKLIEDDLVDVKEKCLQGMKRYAGIKYGKITGATIQFAYNDIYEKFNEIYNVNLYSIQNALIHSWNMARQRKGEKPISYINPNVEGLRVIDVIKRLGMITELYLLISKTIEEYCVENSINIKS